MQQIYLQRNELEANPGKGSISCHLKVEVEHRTC
uniref:Uncharacterized protein n=1 Tax=Arundo donax TaxID=35708 RepID=A0A0A9CG78_ARUDO